MIPSKLEAQQDLNDTKNDVQLLENANLAMQRLVTLSRIENKDVYRSVLHKLQSDVTSGRSLIEKLEKWIPENYPTNETN